MRHYVRVVDGQLQPSAQPSDQRRRRGKLWRSQPKPRIVKAQLPRRPCYALYAYSVRIYAASMPSRVCEVYKLHYFAILADEEVGTHTALVAALCSVVSA